MSEHMRIQLLDPKWREEQRRALEKQKDQARLGTCVFFYLPWLFVCFFLSSHARPGGGEVGVGRGSRSARRGAPHAVAQ